jgi:uncharacterized delta-60 repeat protein
VLTDSRGRVVVAGSGFPLERPVFAVARLTATGVVDREFGRRGVITDRRSGDHWAQVEHLLMLADGRLIAVGWATRGGGSPLSRRYRAVVLRFTASGRLDPSFGRLGRVTIGSAESIARRGFARGRQLVVVGPDDDLRPTRIVFARVPYR